MNVTRFHLAKESVALYAHHTDRVHQISKLQDRIYKVNRIKETLARLKELPYLVNPVNPV
jgi:hypothetical protein